MTRQDVIQILTSINAVIIPVDGKVPSSSEWQKLRQSHPDALDPNGSCNIGVVLGDPSSGIVDVDIDRMSALPLADLFLPKTEMVFGRKSKPRSHRIYKCPEPGRTKQWKDDGGVVIELRGNGGQTVFPSSLHHDSGEYVEFERIGSPTTISWQELEKAVVELAIATEISPSCHLGNRHDIALALAGVLCRAGWPQDRTESFIENLARAHGDNEIEDRRRCVNDAYVFDHPFGLRRLTELTNESTAKWLAKWLGYHEKTSSATAPNGMSLETDLECANVFVAEHKDGIIYDPLAEQFYRRQCGVYVPATDVEIQGLVQAMGESLTGQFHDKDLKRFHSAAGVKNIMTMARPLLIADARNFDSDPLLFGVKNGVVDLRTKTLIENPSSIVTKRFAATYDPDADCPRFKNFLMEITGNDTGLYDYVRRIMGYMLTGKTSEQVIFIAIGSGANGKSTFFSILRSVLGDYAGSTPMNTLMQTKYGNENTYDLAAHEGKRLVIATEGEAGSKLAEAKIKNMTGGDAISCRPIYGKPRTYDPRFKLVLVTNELPEIVGVDEAIWRRIKLIPFRVTFPECRRDPDLKEKLLEERDGIMKFLTECHGEYEAACRKHPGGSGLAEPDVVANEFRDYRACSDTVGMFLAECCDFGGRDFTMTRKLFEAYEFWCRDSGIEPLDKTMFGKCLGKKNLQPHKTAKGNGWKGVVLKEVSSEFRASGRPDDRYSTLN
jgi:putative DNA primase/helicase